MVRLVPMSEEELQAFLERAIPRYAQGQVEAGNWDPPEALERAREAYAQILPDGVIPHNHGIFSLVDEASGSVVGMIWFMVDLQRPRPAAFIYEFEIWEEVRRQGYGTQALLALEEAVREMGVERIALHVFAHNHPARALYEKLGYRITNVNMAKELGDERRDR